MWWCDQPSSRELIVEGEDVAFDEDLTKAATVATHREGAPSLTAANLFVHRGKNDEALFVGLHEAVNHVVLILVVADSLPNACQV